MWHDPLDALIADLDGVVEATPPCTDQLPSFIDRQHFTTRILRRADTAWDGIDPDAVDPMFEAEFAECLGARAPVLHAGPP